MKLTYLKAVGTPIVSEQAEEPVALLRDVFVSPETGAVLAIGIFLSKKIIPMVDIREWTSGGVMIADETAITNREELMRLDQFSINSTRIFGKEVYKEDGKFIGFVEDFVFDPEAGQMVQIYVVRKFLFISLEKRVVSFKDILKIEDKKIIVKNDIKEAKDLIKDFLSLRASIKPQELGPQTQISHLSQEGFARFFAKYSQATINLHKPW